MRTLLFLFVSLLFLSSCSKDPGHKTDLTGPAEDLWGNPVNLADHTTGVTYIQPFSPANCGYCLLDGRFMTENYMAQAEKRGGAGFHQCLFNPQLDVYAFLKHYRDADTPVLTFPPHLHRYHRDGFPFLIAFQAGQKIFSDPVSDYEVSFHSLGEKLWPASPPRLQLPGTMKMATTFINENQADLSLYVVPDGKDKIMKQLQERAASTPPRFAVPPKYQSDLTAEDLVLNHNFLGLVRDFDLSEFSAESSPIHFQKDSFTLGPYTFPTATTAIRVCLPNPHNKQRFAFLELPSEEGKYAPYKGWLDFVVSGKTSADGEMEVLLEGVFSRSEDNKWTWDDVTVNRHPSLAEFCAGGVCPAPVLSADDEFQSTDNPVVPAPQKSSAGYAWSFGSQACRFPDLAIDGQNNCWITWEENGDILLASVTADSAPVRTMTVEGSAADSYNPVIAWDGKLLWVAYVHETRGFYRLYARYWDGRRLSAPIPVSDNLLTDVITPAVTGDGHGRLAAVWTEWRANQRHLMTRTIDHGIRQPVHEVKIAPSDIEYTNAWYPSLAADDQGRFFGAWNQHYPASLGVCGGNLEQQAASITAIFGSYDDNETGGYPDIAIAADGQRWVVWESFGWDVLRGDPQFVFASRFDEKTGSWLKSEVVSDEGVSFFCQTPRLAVLPLGKLCAVWSGRGKTESENSGFGNWGVFMAVRGDEGWSLPKLLSEEGQTARAPRIALAAEGDLWVTWQEGIGDDMRVGLRCFSAGISP